MFLYYQYFFKPVSKKYYIIEQIESNSNKRVENKKQIKIDYYYSKFSIIIIQILTTFQIQTYSNINCQ